MDPDGSPRRPPRAGRRPHRRPDRAHHGLRLRHRPQRLRLLEERQPGPARERRPGARTRRAAAAPVGRRPARRPRRHPDAPRVHRRAARAQRLRDGPGPEARRDRGDDGTARVHGRAPAHRRARPRALTRQEPGHPGRNDRGHHRWRGQLPGADGPVPAHLRRRGRRGRQPGVRPAGGHPRADRGDDHPARRVAQPRVPRGLDWCTADGRSRGPRAGARDAPCPPGAQRADGPTPRSARCRAPAAGEPGLQPPVDRQPARGIVDVQACSQPIRRSSSGSDACGRCASAARPEPGTRHRRRTPARPSLLPDPRWHAHRGSVGGCGLPSRRAGCPAAGTSHRVPRPGAGTSG